MIVVFGSINMDLSFSTPRVPDLGETVMGKSLGMLPGGKGANQAVAAARFGSTVHMIGGVGDDEFGALSVQALREEGVGVDHILKTDQPSGSAVVISNADGDNQIVVAPGANLRVRADDIPANMLGPDVFFIAQCELSLDETWQAIRRAKSAGSTVALNAAPACVVPDDVMRHLDILIVNETEMSIIANDHGAGGTSLIENAKSLAERFGCGVVLTLGANGLVFVDQSQFEQVDGHAVQVVDTTGAGDTVVGVFMSCLEQTLGLKDALSNANLAGAINCTGRGARSKMPTLDDLVEFVSK